MERLASILIGIAVIAIAGYGYLKLSERQREATDNYTSDSELSRIVRLKAAEDNGVQLDRTKIAEIKKADWPDSCLGLSSANELCAQTITPGYKVTVSAGMEKVIYRTNMDGTMIRREN